MLDRDDPAAPERLPLAESGSRMPSVAEVEADIVEGYQAYREEVLEGMWAGTHPAGGISFEQYRADYWEEWNLQMNLL